VSGSGLGSASAPWRRWPRVRLDAAIALLASGGVQVVRSTSNIVDVEFGEGARIGNHLLVFRHDDAEEVAAVLADAGLL
jgi:hypothetical protein